MTFETFIPFAEALCNAAGVKPPPMGSDDDGVIAFHFVLRGVTVDLVHLGDGRSDAPDASNSSTSFFALVTFGPIPELQELQVLRLMAQSNYALIGNDVPVWGRNPESGDIVLRLCFHFHDADPAQCFASLEHFAELARQWRADPTLERLTQAGTGNGATHDPFLFA